MFFAEQGGGGGRAHTPPRPLLIGLLLVLLFLGLSRDRGTPRTGNIVRGGVRTGEFKEGVKDRIIYDLSIDNERLARELLQLKQYVLDVRRAARGCGCTLNDTVLTLFPELHERITEAEVAAAVADVAGRDAASLAISSPAHSSSAATEVAAGRHAGLAAGGALAAGARRQAAEAGSGSTDATGRGQHSQAVDEG